MNTELYIEGFKLDLTNSVSALLTFSIDDIKQFASRSTTWSKTITIPGTSNNNKAFGNIFSIGSSNPYNSNQPNVNLNFNASKSAQCILFQNQMQTFRGVIRLMRINYYNGFNGRVEYEVSVFGNLSNLNAILTGKFLEDLDFSSYDHQFNVNNIISSWDNTSGTGYYYPLIDYGNYSTNKHDWKIKTFRPALFGAEYLDKIFSSSGFRYNMPLANTQRFKSIIVPHASKTVTTNQTNVFSAFSNTPVGYGRPPAINIFDPSILGSLLLWQNISGSGFSSNDPSHVLNTIFTYNGTVSTNLQIDLNVQGNFSIVSVLGALEISIYKNTPNIFGAAWTGVANAINGSPFTITNSSPIVISVSPGDTIQFRVAQDFYSSIDDLEITSASFSVKSVSGSVAIPIQLNDMVTMNDQIPKNIRQIDFLVGIVGLYNLYVYEDKNDPFLIHITPYVEYYSHDLSNALDWTHKLDRSKVIKSQPMSEITAKIYQFKFKSDSDYYNDLYRKRYNEGYGDRSFDSKYEFSQSTKSLEIIFSGTPLVGYAGEDKVYSTIFKRTGDDDNPVEENIDSNIRLLQTKKISFKNLWSMLDDDGNVLNSLTQYGYAGHLDDPDAPKNDLNFGATRELFFILVAGNLSTNQFNLYWSNYMADITDKDSRLITAYFKLNNLDIVNLDFSKYIHIDGVSFKLNQIKDFNATNPDTCQVELLKVISASYNEAETPGTPSDGCYLLWKDDEILDADNDTPMIYGDCSGGGPTPSSYKLNWNWSKGASSVLLNAQFNLYIDNVLSINAVNPSNGVFNLTTGQEIKVEIKGTTGRHKLLFVSNDVDGVVYDDDEITSTHSFTFTVGANRNYTVNASII